MYIHFIPPHFSKHLSQSQYFQITFPLKRKALSRCNGQGFNTCCIYPLREKNSLFIDVNYIVSLYDMLNPRKVKTNCLIFDITPNFD